MLSIKPIGCTLGQVAYYVNLGREDYYVNDNEAPAMWWGRGAHRFGLSGEVNAERLGNLLRGFSPDGSVPLVQQAGSEERRAAFDLTFSGSKSVDAAWSQGNSAQRKAIVDVCERSLRKVLRLFEDQCGHSRRGRFGRKTEKAGLIGAICRHDTSRGLPGKIPDPNLHWHVVVCNVALRADGTTGTIDARKLFETHMKMCLGAMFRAEVSKELEALGLTSHRPIRENGKAASWFELDCVPKELVAEFSSRRQEIEKWLKLKGLSGAKASEMAALETRGKKEEFSRHKLFSSWQESGRKLGFTREHLQDAFSSPVPVRNAEQESREAVHRAVCRITEDRAHFSEVELLRFSAEEAQTRGVGIAEICSEVRSTLTQSPEIVKLTEDVRGVTRYTTREMLELERKLLETVRTSLGNATHQVPPSIVSATIREFPTIRAEQAEAVRHITAGDDSVSVMQGWPGTGKTFALGVARACWETAGMEVIGTALAAKAAQTLEEGSGIGSVHLDRLFWELENKKRTLHSNAVIVCDESGMVGTKKMERLISIVHEANAKLVLVGDYRQLQAIQAGSPLKAIIQEVGCAELSEITRQRAKWARDAVVELALGDAESALKKFAKRGLLTIATDRDEACRRLVDDWCQSTATLDQKLILAGTRSETAMLNRLCQRLRLSRGELSNECHTVGKFDLHVGDRVVFGKNNSSLLVRNGTMGTVTEISPGERGIRVQIDDGFEIFVNTKTYEFVQPAYAQTTHKAQGQTVENAFVLAGGPITHREMAYVQGSRSRGETRLYTDILSGGDDIASLARQMEQSRAKDMAHDHLRLERE